MAGQFIPPNGLAGWMQQTPAVQSMFKKKGNGGGRRRRKAAGKKARAGVRRVARKASKRGGLKRFAKGSAAAKRHMAKLRGMRKRKR